MAQLIEDYALIGNNATAALVGRNGSIDWLCLPRFDSPACFAKLLGDGEHGFWKLSPTHATSESKRFYRQGSLILETIHVTQPGTVRVIDLMPIGTESPQLVRIVEGVEGKVE